MKPPRPLIKCCLRYVGDRISGSARRELNCVTTQRVLLDMCTVFQLDLDALKPTRPLSRGALTDRKQLQNTTGQEVTSVSITKTTNRRLPLTLSSFPAA